MTRSRDTASIIPTVDAKGDLLVGTADNTIDNLSPGTNGQVLAVNSATDSGLEWSTPASAGNAIINGAFDFWQRGTTFTHNISLIYGADRWGIFRGGFAAGATSSRQAAALTGFEYANRVQRVSGNTSTAIMVATQPFESAESIPFAGKQVTLSFFARRGANFSSVENLLNAGIVSGTGTDQTPWGGFTGASFLSVAKTLTTDWQKFSVTATIPTSATQVAIEFKYNPTGTAGANDYFDITGVQLEAGPVATPFRRNANSLQGELAACQRYFQRLGAGAVGRTKSTTIAEVFLNFPVKMRAAPTMTFAGNFNLLEVNVANRTATNASLNGAGDSGASVNLTTSGLTEPNMVGIVSDNNLLFSSEV